MSSVREKKYVNLIYLPFSRVLFKFFVFLEVFLRDEVHLGGIQNFERPKFRMSKIPSASKINQRPNKERPISRVSAAVNKELPRRRNKFIYKKDKF